MEMSWSNRLLVATVLTIASYWLLVPSKQRTSVRGFLDSCRSPVSVSVMARVKEVGGRTHLGASYSIRNWKSQGTALVPKSQ
jgi:hypothetical protein